MSPQLLFAAGWALDAALWQGVLAALDRPAASAAAALLEPGYFSHAPMITPQPRGPTIAIGHSLGLMQVLMAPPPGLAGIVSINGFTRFSQAPDHPEGVPSRLLTRMQRRLAEHADAAALAFRARCGLDTALPGAADPDRLRSGLDLLATGDCRAAVRTLGVPIHALAGSRDAIAPPALTLACFAAPEWVADGGHVLPLTHPRRCADAIHAMLERLS